MDTNFIPSNDSPLVKITNNQITTTSTDIAKCFGKRHDNILRKIENLDCSSEFNALNFEAVEYEDGKGESRPMYRITKDGFVFLAMGFTGTKAAQFKEAYINAFNQMESQLKVAAKPSSTTERKALNICVRSLANARSHAGEPADYASVWKMVNGYLGVAHIEEATIDQVERGVEFVQRAIEGEYIGRLDAPAINPSAELESRVAALEATTVSLEKELNFIHSHAEKLNQEFNSTIYPALKGLNPKLFANVRERMFCIHSHSSKRSVDGWKQQSFLSSQSTH